MKTDIRRYLTADSETRRLKLAKETGTPQSSVQTDNQQDPLQGDIGRQLRTSPDRKLTQQTDTGRKIVGDQAKHQSSSLDRFRRNLAEDTD